MYENESADLYYYETGFAIMKGVMTLLVVDDWLDLQLICDDVAFNVNDMQFFEIQDY